MFQMLQFIMNNNIKEKNKYLEESLNIIYKNKDYKLKSIGELVTQIIKNNFMSFQIIYKICSFINYFILIFIIYYFEILSCISNIIKDMILIEKSIIDKIYTDIYIIMIFILYLFIFFNIKNYLDKNHNEFIEYIIIQIKYSMFVKYNKVINMTFLSNLEITLNQITLYIKNINYYFDFLLLLFNIIIFICIRQIKSFKSSFKLNLKSIMVINQDILKYSSDDIENMKLQIEFIITFIIFLYIIISFILCIIKFYNVCVNITPLEKESISSYSLFSNLFNNSIPITYNKGSNFSKEAMKKNYILEKEDSIENNDSTNNIFFMPLLLYILYFITIIIFFMIIKLVSQLLNNNQDFFKWVQYYEIFFIYYWSDVVIILFISLPIFINHVLLNCINYYLLQIIIIGNRFEYLKYPLHGTTYDIKTIKNISFKNFECFFMDRESEKEINLKMNELNRLNKLYKKYISISYKTSDMEQLIKEAPTKIENLKISIEELIKKSKIKKITNLINVKIDFAKNGGSYVMVIGETGCGKSTLISYFLRILEDNEKYLKYLNKTKEEADELSEDDNGIFINDKILSACNENLKNNIYTIIQQPSKNLIASWNVRTNILFEHASKINNNDNNNESSEGKIYEKILNATCKIACFNSKHSSLNNLSGGEQQRLSIASTFAKWLIKVKEQIGEEKLDEILNILNNFDCEDWEKQFKLEEIDLFDELYESPLFIFDEITSALDINTAKKIIKQIHILRNIFNLHIIEITHSPHNAILKDNDTILQFNKEIKDDMYTLRQSTAKEFLNTNQNNKS